MSRLWNHERVICEIQYRHRAGLPLTYVWRDWPGLYRAAQRYCGNWQQAVLEAGLSPRPFRRWSKERVVKELRAWYREPQREHDDWDHGLFSAATRYCGSWKQALQAAGLEPKRYRTWTRQRVIAAIQDRHVRGLPITRIERRNRSLATAARYYFGGWRDALEAAGLGEHYQPVRSPRDWHPQSVVAEIQECHQQGLPLTKVWQQDPTLYSAAKKQFGSWRAALQAAGFQATRRAWTKQEILAEIHARCREGESLSSGLPANKTLAAAAVRYFGSWAKALQAAGVVTGNQERNQCHAKQ